MKFIQLLAFLLLFSTFTSCSSEPVPIIKADVPVPTMKLICKAEKSKVDNVPAHSVYLIMDDTIEVKVADIIACETFKKAEYDRYQIPKTAMDACGGWWAGAGEYFYLNKKSDYVYAVNYGQMYEEKETGKYDYSEIMSVEIDETGKYVALPKIKMDSLAGVYVLQAPDKYWMLVLQPEAEEEKLKATYYAMDGKLPATDFFTKNELPAGGTELKNFSVDFSDMVVESDLGGGQFETIFRRERITFFNIKSHQEEVLRLTKVK